MNTPNSFERSQIEHVWVCVCEITRCSWAHKFSHFTSHINKPLRKVFFSQPPSIRPSLCLFIRSIACLHSKHIMRAFALCLAISRNQFDLHLHSQLTHVECFVVALIVSPTTTDLRPAHLLSCDRYYCHCNWFPLCSL